MNKTTAYIKSVLLKRKISQHELALKASIPFQNLSSVLQGKRTFSIATSIRIDDALGLETGTIALMQTKDAIEKEKNSMSPKDNILSKQHLILQKVKDNGGLWSYNSIPEKMSDDDIIEQALRHLDFEDMHYIFEIWNKAHIKRIWKERLVSEGKRMNILNTLLGILFFNVKDINSYLQRHGHPAI